MSISTPSSGVNSLDARITSTAACLNAASVSGSCNRGGGPGSSASKSAAKESTRAHCGATKTCTLPGIGMPFWLTWWLSASGCQRSGSSIAVPGSATMSGSLIGE